MKHMKQITLCLSLGTFVSLAGCTMAPTYSQPAVPVPVSWPNGPSYQKETANPLQKPLADITWQDFYLDGQLQKLIALALENNRDLRVAALNIEKSQALYRIKRADLIPKIDATASINNQAAVNHQYSLGIGISSYELDLFGRVQSLKDQALEQYLATEQAQRTVQISLIAEVAGTYLNLAADRERLKLAQETLKTQQTSFQLIQRRFEVGASSELDLRQAQTLVDSARVDVARYTTLVAQDENNLNFVVGSNIQPEILPQALSETLTAVKDITPGLPSGVLLQRPDVLQAENLLKGYNANIGAARAAFFPRITLITSYGTTSDEVSGLFKSGSGVWTFTPQITLPIFDAGARSAQLKVSEVDRDIAVAQYEKAIQTAFREVADALAQRGTIDEQVAAQESFITATDKRYTLSQARYEKGIDSYLNILDAQRSLYSAQQALIGTRLTRLANLVTLYKVLGGGWKERT
jgi:outer membrane protein, multidrug efflux system